MAVRRHQFGSFSLDPNERRGLLITVTGGRLFGGSLSLLAEGFPGARLRLDLLGQFAAGVTSMLEGAWFSLCLVGALMLARR